MPIEFWQTGMGHKLIQTDVPRIAKALERIATALEEQNALTASKVMPSVLAEIGVRP
jgi:hypothetical protein